MFSIKRCFIILFCVVAFFHVFGASPLPSQPNPVALSVGLFNQDTPNEVGEYGKYYHLSEVNHSDKECVFTALDGSKLSFIFGDGMGKRVELTTKLSRKEVTRLLEECQFEKMKEIPAEYRGMNVYEKKGSSFSSVRTVCIFSNSSPITLTFLKEKR